MGRDGENEEVIWVKSELKYFCEWGWTVDSALSALAKFDFWRNVIFVIPGREQSERARNPTPVFKFGAERCHRAYGFRACAKGRIPE